MDSEAFRRFETSNVGGKSMANESEDGKPQKRPPLEVRKGSIEIANSVLESIDEKIANKFYGITSTDDDEKTNIQTEETLLSRRKRRKIKARIRKAYKFGRTWDTKKKPALLALPTEIRLTIYDLILNARDIIVIEATGQRENDGTYGPKTPAYGQLVGLLLTCEQISLELKYYIRKRCPGHVDIYRSFGPVNLESRPYFIVRFPWNLDGDNFSSDEEWVYVDRIVIDEPRELWDEPWDFDQAKNRIQQLTNQQNWTVASCNEFFIFEAKTSRDLLRMWVWKQVMKPNMSRREFNTQVKRFVKKDPRIKALLKETKKHKERCFGYRFEIGVGWRYWHMHWKKGFGTFYGGRVSNSHQWDESDIYRLFEIEAR